MDTPNSTFLPDNDPDLMLSKAIGRALEENTPFTAVDDSMVNLLSDYKEQQQPATVHSSMLWEGIQKHMETDQSAITKHRVLPLFQRTALKPWAAAAAILLIALTAVFWGIYSDQPSLISQSGSEIASVVLDDGSEVTLRPHSYLYKTKARGYTLEGEAFFDVVTDTEAPFTVTIGKAKIMVLGTRFNASSWGDKPTVYLEEGRISFSEILTNDSIILEPGQSAYLAEGLAYEDADPGRYLDWINNSLILDNSTFKSVLDEIEQHYQVNLTLSDSTVSDVELNGTITLDSLEYVLSDLEILMDGSFRKTSDGTYIFEPNQ